ncbi:MAG: AraC family transcriptional regulator [Pedobacter sp.]|nr:MAG: AraC family transcriptional regulator [Pedobacter sp.]
MNQDYIKRVNRILTFIDQNIDGELSLEKVAAIGHYSPFHLHRIFKEVTSETLNSYINRKRIEKTAAMLMHRKDFSIAEIYLQNGFGSNSSFTRAFKKFYGVSPTQYRALSPDQFSKISQTDSKNGQVEGLIGDYICTMNEIKNWIDSNATIEIKTLPKRDFAYITQIGVMGMSDAFGRLIKWATPLGLVQSENLKLARIYHDSFKITAPEKVRMSVCILLDDKINVDGEVGLTTIPDGKFIIGRFEIEPKNFEKSWRGLFAWMNDNGYQKGDQNPFEIYHNDFNTHPEKKFIVDLHIPIK